MKSKIVLLSLITLSTLGAMSISNQSASAKAKATIKTQHYLSTKGELRDVVPTGKNALYTRPGTVKNAKRILTTKQMKDLGKSKHSHDYLRAYRMAITSRGSVYYKVVSFDKKYRGYVYAGKSQDGFSAGLKSTITTNPVGISDTVTDATYHFKDNPAAYTRNFPTMTQYKITRKFTDMKKYLKDDLKVTKATKRIREGSVYYYVTSAKHPEINGWIYKGYLTMDKGDNTGNNGNTNPSTPEQSTTNLTVKGDLLDANTGESVLNGQVRSDSDLIEQVHMQLDEDTKGTVKIGFNNSNTSDLTYTGGTLTITNADGTITKHTLTSDEIDALNKGELINVTGLTSKDQTAMLQVTAKLGDKSTAISSQPIIKVDDNKVVVNGNDKLNALNTDVEPVARVAKYTISSTLEKSTDAGVNNYTNGDTIDLDKQTLNSQDYVYETDIRLDSNVNLQTASLDFTETPSQMSYYKSGSVIIDNGTSQKEVALSDNVIEDLNNYGSLSLSEISQLVKPGDTIKVKLTTQFQFVTADTDWTSVPTLTSNDDTKLEVAGSQGVANHLHLNESSDVSLVSSLSYNGTDIADGSTLTFVKVNELRKKWTFKTDITLNNDTNLKDISLGFDNTPADSMIYKTGTYTDAKGNTVDLTEDQISDLESGKKITLPSELAQKGDHIEVNLIVWFAPGTADTPGVIEFTSMPMLSTTDTNNQFKVSTWQGIHHALDFEF